MNVFQDSFWQLALSSHRASRFPCSLHSLLPGSARLLQCQECSSVVRVNIVFFCCNNAFIMLLQMHYYCTIINLLLSACVCELDVGGVCCLACTVSVSRPELVSVACLSR